MFIHNFKYSLKTLFRNKSLIFWTFAFPIILGTFFNLAFSDIEKSEKLDIIDIAIVNNENFENNEILKTAFKELSAETNSDRLFNTKYVDESEAKKMLDDKEIVGYLIMEGNNPKIIVRNSGTNETILKYITDEITQNAFIIANLAQEEIESEMMNGSGNSVNYEKIYMDVLQRVQKQNVTINNTANSNLSYTMIEFYTLIAMACLYSGILGMSAINQNLPDMSNNGKRIAISPLSKMKVVISSTLASYITALIGLAILFLYTVFVLKVNYGNNLLLIILLGMVGTLAGLSMGIILGTCLKTNSNTKTGILLAFTMFGCFLSGMMGITMKYVVDTNMPIANKINPASMITDGFYSLYYYDTLDRFFFNIASLLVFSGILITLSCIKLRRQKYDSI